MKKQPLRTEKDFVKFDTHFLPKPLFFRKAKSSAAARPAERAVQVRLHGPVPSLGALWWSGGLGAH